MDHDDEIDDDIDLYDLFEKHDGEYLKFEKITESDRRHPRPDVCAFIYLHEKLGGKHNIVSDADHDIIYLGFDYDDLKKLTEEDVIYLRRCGVMYHTDNSSLAMFT